MDAWKLPKIVIGQVLVRSFFIQASWNFERLQSLGMLYVLAPALRFLYRGEELSAASRRHLEYFNTHPFLASPVVGTLLALEEKNRKGEKVYLGIDDFKRMAMAPYAAIGDALFWGGIRPAAAGIALFFAVRGSLWAPVVFLTLFNIPHLAFRTLGLLQGYREGLRMVEVIQHRRFPDLAIRLKEGTVVLLGGLCAYLSFLTLRGETAPIAWGLAAVPIVLLLGRLTRYGISTLLLILATATLVVSATWFF